MSNRLGIIALVLGLLVAGPVNAHHSFAAFDRTKQLEITGVVKEWQWTNPHSWLAITVVEGNGDVDYEFEGFSPSILPRYGITRDKFKPGDRVTVKYFARKDDAHGGQFISVDLVTGDAQSTPSASDPSTSK